MTTMLDVGRRWARIEEDLAERRFSPDMLELPPMMVERGVVAPLAAASPALLEVLRARAEALAPESIGPRHHAVARALAALASIGTELGPVLALVCRMWAPPSAGPSGARRS